MAEGKPGAAARTGFGIGYPLLLNQNMVTILTGPDQVNINQNKVTNLIAQQSKMARVATGLGVRDLAKAAGVSPDTIARFERGEELRSSTVEAIRKALEAQGVQFLEGGQVASGPGVALGGRE